MRWEFTDATGPGGYQNGARARQRRVPQPWAAGKGACKLPQGPGGGAAVPQTDGCMVRKTGAAAAADLIPCCCGRGSWLRLQTRAKMGRRQEGPVPAQKPATRTGLGRRAGGEPRWRQRGGGSRGGRGAKGSAGSGRGRLGPPSHPGKARCAFGCACDPRSFSSNSSSEPGPCGAASGRPSVGRPSNRYRSQLVLGEGLATSGAAGELPPSQNGSQQAKEIWSGRTARTVPFRAVAGEAGAPTETASARACGPESVQGQKAEGQGKGLAQKGGGRPVYMGPGSNPGAAPAERNPQNGRGARRFPTRAVRALRQNGGGASACARGTARGAL
jgi:hypothetical protein